MRARIINESSMEDSYIFKQNNMSGEITTKMIAYIKSATPINEEYLQEQILQIKKTRISPLADEVLAAFARGEIELLYNKKVKVSGVFPFIVRRDPSFRGNIYGVRATIFISNFGMFDKMENNFIIDMKKLYVLMESAYIGLCISTRPETVRRNMGLMRCMCSIYTEMIKRLMNREFSLNLDEDLYAKVSYCISKFFLTKIWESNNDEVNFNVALSCIRLPNISMIKMVDEQYNQANIKDLPDMLLFIKTLSPKLDTLSVRYIIEYYVKTYHPTAALSIDYLPYLFFVVIDTVIGGYTMNQKMLSDIMKHEPQLKNFYAELGRIILH